MNDEDPLAPARGILWALAITAIAVLLWWLL
jgi:hypothetical protein